MAHELANSARVKPQKIEPDEAILRQAHEQVAAAGYPMRLDADLSAIAGYRSEYRGCVKALAEHLGKPVGELVRQE